MRELPDAGPGSPTGPLEPPLPIRSAWVRSRLRVPELERLLRGPIGARIDDNFDSLRVRLAKAVDRIGEEAGMTGEEIRVRARAYRLGALTCAVVGIAALWAAAVVPSYRVTAVMVALAELAGLAFFSRKGRRLARDLIAVQAWGERYRASLEAARVPEDLHRLAARLREEEAALLGGVPPGAEAPEAGG